MSSVDFIVPTLRRPDHLRRCLNSIIAQSVPTVSVLVGVRQDDAESQLVINDYSKEHPVVAVQVEGVGVIGSMNSCLRHSSSSFIALVDDDVELPSHWLAVMLDRLSCDPSAVASGGRDLLMDHPEMRREESLTNDVGKIWWFGRLSGNHHRGGGTVRAVDVLRGSNILFDGGFIRKVGFDSRLAGQGAQVNWELAIALAASNFGKHLLYDPECKVIHHVAPRHDNDSVHRGIFDWGGTRDMAFNETFVFLAHGKGLKRIAPITWQFLIGSATCPGIARVLVDTVREPRHLLHRFTATLAGRFGAFKTWLCGGKC
jgi:glycosyltransferase involved in cell wall biosynthesis